MDEDVEPVMQGLLTKQGEKRKNWNIRWFVLEGSGKALHYYASKKDKKPKGSIAIDEKTLVSMNASKNRPHCFEIGSGDIDRRVFYLVASSAEDMNQWMTKLREVIEGFRRKSNLPPLDPDFPNPSVKPDLKLEMGRTDTSPGHLTASKADHGTSESALEARFASLKKSVEDSVHSILERVDQIAEEQQNIRLKLADLSLSFENMQKEKGILPVRASQSQKETRRRKTIPENIGAAGVKQGARAEGTRTESFSSEKKAPVKQAVKMQLELQLKQMASSRDFPQEEKKTEVVEPKSSPAKAKNDVITESDPTKLVEESQKVESEVSEKQSAPDVEKVTSISKSDEIAQEKPEESKPIVEQPRREQPDKNEVGTSEAPVIPPKPEILIRIQEAQSAKEIDAIERNDEVKTIVPKKVEEEEDHDDNGNDGKIQEEVSVTKDKVVDVEAAPESTQLEEEVVKPEWLEVWDEDEGRYYYYNESTMESVWERPKGAVKSFDAESESQEEDEKAEPGDVAGTGVQGPNPMKELQTALAMQALARKTQSEGITNLERKRNLKKSQNVLPFAVQLKKTKKKVRKKKKAKIAPLPKEDDPKATTRDINEDSEEQKAESEGHSESNEDSVSESRNADEVTAITDDEKPQEEHLEEDKVVEECVEETDETGQPEFEKPSKPPPKLPKPEKTESNSGTQLQPKRPPPVPSKPTPTPM